MAQIRHRRIEARMTLSWKFAMRPALGEGSRVCVEADTPCRGSSIKGSNWVGEEFHSDRRERFILLFVSSERGRDIGGGAGSRRVKCGHTAALISFITTSGGKVYQHGAKVQSNLVIKDNSTSEVPNWNRSVFH